MYKLGFKAREVVADVHDLRAADSGVQVGHRDVRNDFEDQFISVCSG